jgi:hypothetical protein
MDKCEQNHLERTFKGVINKHACDLIRKLLVFDASDRITAHDALRATFFKVNDNLGDINFAEICTL